MKKINNWLNTEIDNNYFNYNVIKLLYVKIKNIYYWLWICRQSYY